MNFQHNLHTTYVLTDKYHQLINNDITYSFIYLQENPEEEIETKLDTMQSYDEAMDAIKKCFYK